MESVAALSASAALRSAGASRRVAGGIQFDRWLVPCGEALRALCGDCEAILQAGDKRVRQRKEQDAKRYRATLEALICNLVRAISQTGAAGPAALVLPLAHSQWAATRYGNKTLSREAMRQLLDAGDAAGLLSLEVSAWRGVASTLVPTEAFAKEVAARGLGAADYVRAEGEELIVLRAKDDGLQDYKDTPEVRALREEVARLNAFLAAADIAFLGDGLGAVDPSARRLRRYFSLLPNQRKPTWTHGGRLFGGWWETLSKERRGALRINGHPIAEVDMSACFLRIASGLAGGAPLDGCDPYGQLPSFKAHRKGAKMALSALLFAATLKRFPQDISKHLPPKTSVKAFREEVLGTFPALGSCLEGGSTGAAEPIGYTLMHLESAILLAALDELRNADVVALPLHDAVLVARGNEEAARRALEGAALKVAGVFIPTQVKSW